MRVILTVVFLAANALGLATAGAVVTAAVASGVKVTCLQSLVPGWPTLCIHNANGVRTIVTPTPSPTPVPTATPTASPTPVPTATPTVAPTASPTPVPTITPSPQPTGSPTATPPPGTIVWQLGTAGLDNWKIGVDGQCEAPVVMNGPSGSKATMYYFDLKQNGTQCMRNQNLPLLPNNSTLPLVDQGHYWFSFDYYDSGPNGSSPGMGNDTGEAQRIFWQIHGLGECCTPLTQLGFGNTPPNSSTGQPQEWVMSGCGTQHSLSSPFWTASYTPGEIDHFDIEVLVSETASGYINLYRNHKLVAACTGPTYQDSPSGSPFWNVGPYVWRWSLPGEGGSLMTEVQMLMDGLTVRQL